jgi:hypothetical protein
MSTTIKQFFTIKLTFLLYNKINELHTTTATKCTILYIMHNFTIKALKTSAPT